jgi:hypothetical protein
MAWAKGPRKLLIASVGVATVNYVLAGCETGATSGNLPAPQGGFVSTGGKAGGGVGGPPVVANLPAPMGGFPPFAGNAGQSNAGTAGTGAGGMGGSQGGTGGKLSDGGAGGETSGGAGGAP